jgi:PAS domain S-box-containing protein
LALRLRAPAPFVETPRTAALAALGDSLISPALSALADALALPVWIADSHFVYEWINPAFAAVLGVDAGEVCGTTWWRWCEPLDIPRVSQVMDAAALEQRNWSVEFGAGRPGGPYSRSLVVAAPRIAPAGETVGWTGICFDITHGPSLGTRLESMSGMLTADTARSQLLLRQFPGVIWTTDTQLRCTSTIGAGLAALGQAPNQVVGLTIPQLRGTDDPEHPVIRAHRAAVHGESASYDDAWMGRSFAAHIEPLRDAGGNIVGCVGISRDITERLEAFAQNQRLGRQLALAQRIGPIGSREFDVATGSYLWSEEGYRLLGLAPGSVEPTFDLFVERVHPDDRERMMRLHAEQLRSGEGYVIDYRLVGPDGRLRSMRGTVEFEYDASGTLVRVIGVLQDVTPPVTVPGPPRAVPSLVGVDPPASVTEQRFGDDLLQGLVAHRSGRRVPCAWTGLADPWVDGGRRRPGLGIGPRADPDQLGHREVGRLARGRGGRAHLRAVRHRDRGRLMCADYQRRVERDGAASSAHRSCPGDS